MARAGFRRTLSCLHGSGVPMGPRTPPWASVGPQASARSRFRRAFSSRTRTLQPGLSSLIPTSTGTSGAGGKPASEGGARHAGPAAPRLGLAPAAPAARPAAAPVRRKRRRRRRRPLGELGAPAALAGPMADLSPAPALREGGPRAHRPSAPSPPPRSRSTSEPEEAELSLSLARTKTRSYGSTASVRAPLGAGVIERHVEHRVRAGDTLQGIALKYGVTVSRARRRGLGLWPPGGVGDGSGGWGAGRASPRLRAASQRALLQLQWASMLRPPELSRPSSAWRFQYPPCQSQVVSVARETPMRPAFWALLTATFTRFPTRSSLHIYSKPHGYEFCAV